LAEETALLKRLDEEYYIYVRGEADQARESLLRALELIQTQRCLTPLSNAELLFLHYARLATLERVVGDEHLSEAILLKVKYWRMRNLEILGTPTLKAFRDSQTLDFAQCTQIVETMDANLNGGKPASYNGVLSGP
jgi:hypothetical protein